LLNKKQYSVSQIFPVRESNHCENQIKPFLSFFLFLNMPSRASHLAELDAKKDFHEHYHFGALSPDKASMALTFKRPTGR